MSLFWTAIAFASPEGTVALRPGEQARANGMPVQFVKRLEEDLARFRVERDVLDVAIGGEAFTETHVLRVHSVDDDLFTVGLEALGEDASLLARVPIRQGATLLEGLAIEEVHRSASVRWDEPRTSTHTITSLKSWTADGWAVGFEGDSLVVREVPWVPVRADATVAERPSGLPAHGFRVDPATAVTLEDGKMVQVDNGLQRVELGPYPFRVADGGIDLGVVRATVHDTSESAVWLHPTTLVASLPLGTAPDLTLPVGDRRLLLSDRRETLSAVYLGRPLQIGRRHARARDLTFQMGADSVELEVWRRARVPVPLQTVVRSPVQTGIVGGPEPTPPPTAEGYRAMSVRDLERKVVQQLRVDPQHVGARCTLRVWIASTGVPERSEPMTCPEELVPVAQETIARSRWYPPRVGREKVAAVVSVVLVGKPTSR